MGFRVRDGLLWAGMRLIKALDFRETHISHLKPGEVKNILVVSSTALGDTLFSTPGIRVVRRQYPRAKIVGHFHVRYLDIFKNNPHVDSVIPYFGGYRRFFSTISEMRRENFDLALIFHGNGPQVKPMAYLSGARFVVRVPNESEYTFLLSNPDPRPENTADMSLHVIDDRLKVAALAGCPTDDRRMELTVAEESRDRVETLLADRGIQRGHIVTGLQVGAATPSRRWPPKRYAELIKSLAARSPALRFVLTGSPGERQILEEVREAAGVEHATVTAGHGALGDLPALIERFNVLVTPDTGVLHMAVALGTPTVSLFAMADSKRSGPGYDLEKHHIIQKSRTCEDCVSKRCEYAECMEAITVKEVADAVMGRLGDSRGPKRETR